MLRRLWSGLIVAAILGSLQIRALDCSRQFTAGHWVSNTTAKNGIRWTPFSEDCSLVEAFSVMRSRSLSVFVLGDSVDYWFLRDICEKAWEDQWSPIFEMTPHISAQPFPEQAVHGYDSFSTCQLRDSLIHFAFITGISETGEAHHSGIHSQRTAAVRLQDAAKNFYEYQTRSPDIIVLSTNFWDHFRMQHSPAGVTNQTVLQLWSQEFSAFVRHIDQAFPEVPVKVYHTSAFTTREDLSQPVTQDLNMAAISLLDQQPDWSVVNLVALTAGFKNRTSYLRDQHHPQPFIHLTLFDICVSLLEYKLAA